MTPSHAGGGVHWLLAGMKKDAGAVETSLAVHCKMKHTTQRLHYWTFAPEK